MRVLIVDDDKSSCDYLEKLISDEGHSCILAGTFDEAVEALSQESVDFIFLDVYLPGKNGFQLAKKIRRLVSTPWVPIVFVSGSDSDADYKKAVDAGGDDYLVKPIRPIVIQTKLKMMERIASMRTQVDTANAKLKKLNSLDSLTKTYNRRYLQQALVKEWRHTIRTGTPLSVIMLDVDFFKKYNDFYGHLKGDLCLQKVAKVLQSQANRPRDVVARYGGEEFIVVLPETDLGGAMSVAQKIAATVAKKKLEHPSSEVSGQVTVSMGVCCNNQNIETYSQLCENADKALYEAKFSGRNRIQKWEVT